MFVDTLDRKRLLDDLRTREFRQIFYAEHIGTALPMQTRELRKERKLSQAALAELVGTDQKNISNWENPNYEYKPQIGTLLRLADVFDVPLIVRFGSWDELLDWEFNLSPRRLTPQNFERSLARLKKKFTNKEIGKIKDTAELDDLPLFHAAGLLATGGSQLNIVSLEAYRNRKAGAGSGIPTSTNAKLQNMKENKHGRRRESPRRAIG